MKKHITEILIERGYKTYKFINKTNWNPEAKRQSQKILESHKNNVIFKEGDFDSDESSFYVPSSFNTIYHQANYNVLAVGGLDIRFIKDGDFENEIIYGLREFKKPPTLVWPRPSIMVKRISHRNGKTTPIIENQSLDNSMNLCLKEESHEDILEAMSSGRVFEYDLTSNK